MATKIETSAVAIGSILRVGSTYEVPAFQRDFSWSEDQYGRFWDDLMTSIEANREDYFLGSMVFNDAQSSVLSVIDGQQRLTIVSILLCALREAIKVEGNTTLAEGLERDFLGRLDYQTGISVPKLVLNKTNKQFFYDNIFKATDNERLKVLANASSQRKSNRLLAKAYLYLVEKLAELRIRKGNYTSIVGEIVTALDNRLSIIQIKVKDDYDAYLLFETLNDRGLTLSVSDLLKNHLFSKAGGYLQQVQQDWEEMVSNLGKLEIKSFLRHFWLSREGIVRDKELFRLVRDRYSSTQHVVSFSRQLRESSSFYGAFIDPENSWWDQFPPQEKVEIQSLIDQLNLFGVSQCYPILLAALEENAKLFLSVLRMMVVFTFRYSIIGGLGTGNLERAFTEAALLIRSNPQCSVPSVFEKIRHLNPADQEFTEKFSSKEIQDNALARHILARINDKLTGQNGLATETNPNKLNLEHIAPKKYGADWLAKFGGDEELANDYIYRLGNLTLLPSRLNRALQNAAFAEKLQRGLAQNPLEITKPILAKSEWGKAEIEERQNWLARQAAGVWNLSY